MDSARYLMMLMLASLVALPLIALRLPEPGLPALSILDESLPRAPIARLQRDQVRLNQPDLRFAL